MSSLRCKILKLEKMDLDINLNSELMYKYIYRLVASNDEQHPKKPESALLTSAELSSQTVDCT